MKSASASKCSPCLSCNPGHVGANPFDIGESAPTQNEICRTPVIYDRSRTLDGGGPLLSGVTYSVLESVYFVLIGL